MITIDHLVRRITVRILLTCPHLQSANFGPCFTRWQSTHPHFTCHRCCTMLLQFDRVCNNIILTMQQHPVSGFQCHFIVDTS